MGASATGEKRTPVADAPGSPTPVADGGGSPELTAVGSAGWKGDYQLVDTPEKFDKFLANLEKQPASRSTRRRPTSIRCEPTSSVWSSAGRKGRRTTCRSAGRRARVLDENKVLEKLRPILENRRGQGQPEHQVRHAGAAAARASVSRAWPATAWWPITSCMPASAAITWRNWPVVISIIRSSPSRT